MTIQRVFSVDGKSFFPLGGQVHNSSSYMPGGLDLAWQALAALQGEHRRDTGVLGADRAGAWSFRFQQRRHACLRGAREHSLRLILLWFGTWKNGTMKYAPVWVKNNPRHFWRVISADGHPIGVLSAHCEATSAADRRAFCALMKYLQQHDTQRTVIAIQIQNEPGIIGSDRDYGPEAGTGIQ